MADFIAKNLQKYRELAPRFQEIFGAKLKPFFDNITGFDVIKFDDLVQPEENESTEQAVRRQWGDEGVDLVLKLMG